MRAVKTGTLVGSFICAFTPHLDWFSCKFDGMTAFGKQLIMVKNNIDLAFFTGISSFGQDV